MDAPMQIDWCQKYILYYITLDSFGGSVTVCSDAVLHYLGCSFVGSFQNVVPILLI